MGVFREDSFIKRNKDFIAEIGGLNECHILHGTILSKYTDEYGIVNMGYGIKWRSINGRNTHEERQKRVKIAYDVIKNSGIKIRESGIKTG